MNCLDENILFVHKFCFNFWIHLLKDHSQPVHVQQMELEFDSWMKFYGKESGSYQLRKGDFLDETYQEAISSATYVILYKRSNEL